MRERKMRHGHNKCGAEKMRESKIRQKTAGVENVEKENEAQKRGGENAGKENAVQDPPMHFRCSLLVCAAFSFPTTFSVASSLSGSVALRCTLQLLVLIHQCCYMLAQCLHALLHQPSHTILSILFLLGSRVVSMQDKGAVGSDGFKSQP